MKTPTLFGFIFILLSTGFTNVATGQEYTYRLTVTSLSEEEQSFNVEISGKIGSSAEPITMVLSDQTTPFERILETGEHVVIVEHPEEQGLVESKITGIVDGETKGSASADYRHTILKAGPGGRYSASQ